MFQFGPLPLQLRLKPRLVGVQFGMTVGHGPRFIEHGGDIPRHVDMIGCGMAGLSLLDGALDVKVKGMRQDGQDACDRRLTARTVPMTSHPSIIDVTGPIGSAGEPDRGDIDLPTAEAFYGKSRDRVTWSA